jgi:hypothetical protein
VRKEYFHRNKKRTMKKYILIIALGINLVGHAQICDDIQNNTTDPSNPKALQMEMTR